MERADQGSDRAIPSTRVRHNVRFGLPIDQRPPKRSRGCDLSGIEVTRTSVHCEESWHDFYRTIADRRRESAGSIPFATMTQAFVTLACIGRAEGHYVQLSKGREIFIAPSFDRDLHVPVLVALARSEERRVGQEGSAG